MGCTSCKEKKEIKKRIYESTGSNDGKIILVLTIILLFTIYGIISFVQLFI